MQRAASVQSDLSRVCTSGAAVRFIQRCSRRLMLAATIMRLQLYTRQDKQESYVCVQGNRVLSIFAKRKVPKYACNHTLCTASVAASSIAGSCASGKGQRSQAAQCRAGVSIRRARRLARAISTDQRRCPEMLPSRQPRQRCSTTRAASTAVPRARTIAGSAQRTTSPYASTAPACTAR